MAAHIASSGHATCTCGGYWYPHRPGSPCCELHPLATHNRAWREGADLYDVLWHLGGVPAVAGEAPPF